MTYYWFNFKFNETDKKSFMHIMCRLSMAAVKEQEVSPHLKVFSWSKLLREFALGMTPPVFRGKSAACRDKKKEMQFTCESEGGVGVQQRSRLHTLTLFPRKSPASLALSTDTERLFSNILTRVRTDCGRMAGSSCVASTGDGEGDVCALGGGGGGVGLPSELAVPTGSDCWGLWVFCGGGGPWPKAGRWVAVAGSGEREAEEVGGRV